MEVQIENRLGLSPSIFFWKSGCESQLKTKNENSLLAVANNLTELGIPHCCWIENPENIKTCIATAPVLRSDLKDALKKCSLYRQ
ncbi:hypothetical protein DSO57_1011668 [Entomophthora muscae]|uniref:Uncharacterized protein n=1 Tax=Entomophthora muscae TaxID=34485 RepID=A0ACC2RXB9_9FUNG|nr:hypothetical protein DSO57_1011668 [Entomophthora muscae]